MKQVSGFSKLTKLEKIELLSSECLKEPNSKEIIKSFWHQDISKQELFDQFSENTLTNFYIPYGVVPNVLLNGNVLCVPMAIEESSVVAAASKAAKFWFSRGGVNAKIISTKKVGHVHFIWNGCFKKLFRFFENIRPMVEEEIFSITKSMTARGGGISDISLIDKTEFEPGYHQIKIEFETCDAMGANFINSVLEAVAHVFKKFVAESKVMNGSEKNVQIIMSILSNYTPECLVEASMECDISELDENHSGMKGAAFADKFANAVRISKVDLSRAVTHNKGIFNGVDAVVMATGNDFRATSACGHAYAARHGSYKGLTDLSLANGKFRYDLKIPLAVGTVGGLTSLHPMAKLSLEMLNHPSAKELMSIIAAIGLLQNFAAIRSLVTSGIQKGHMKMHLMNILNHLEADEKERMAAREWFADRVISFNDVREYLATSREYH